LNATYVVLAHELVELNLFGVLPPLLPLVGIGRGDRWVSEASVEPHVDDLLLISRKRHWHTPLHITSDRSSLEPAVDPTLCNGYSVRRPVSFLAGFLKPLLNIVLQFVESQKDMGGLAGDGGGSVNLAFGVDELKGVQELAALVASGRKEYSQSQV